MPKKTSISTRIVALRSIKRCPGEPNKIWNEVPKNCHVFFFGPLNQQISGKLMEAKALLMEARVFAATDSVVFRILVPCVHIFP